MRRAILLILITIAGAGGTMGQQAQPTRPSWVPLPPPMQFVDRILRPCASGATPYVSAIAASDGDFDITTCVGGQVTINGSPISGGGLADPGSNGIVVRTALNTTTARTLTAGAGISITDGNGVAGNPTITATGGGGGIGTGNVNMTVANEGVTGTTTNRLAKLTGAPSTATITATSDTEGAVGVCTSGCGTAGNATIAILGQVSCEFDGATTAGNYVVISSVTAGKCHDAGASFPTSSAAYGRVLSTNGAGGTYALELMTPDIAFQNAGNGKSRPAGSSTEFQYRDNNQFGAGNLFREDANTVAQRNGTTAQNFFQYGTFTSATNYERARVGVLDVTNVGIASEKGSGGGSARDVTLDRDGARIRFAAGFFLPNTTNTISLGGSSNIWTDVFGNRLLGNTVSLSTSGNKAVLLEGSARSNGGVLNIQTAASNPGTIGGAQHTSTQLSANQNDFTFEGNVAFSERLSSNASRNITGFSLSQVGGQIHFTHNIGSNPVVLTNQDTGSTAANRLITNTGMDLPLNADQNGLIIYDATTQRWRAGKFETSETANVTSQFDKTTSTALATVTGLSFNVSASRTYNFTANLYYDADVTGGAKFAIGGTATATAIIFQINTVCNASNLFVINSRQTTVGGSAGQAGCTGGHTQINGTITVNAAGTLVVQFAQNASNGTSSVLIGSTFFVNNIN